MRRRWADVWGRVMRVRLIAAGAATATSRDAATASKRPSSRANTRPSDPTPRRSPRPASATPEVPLLPEAASEKYRPLLATAASSGLRLSARHAGDRRTSTRSPPRSAIHVKTDVNTALALDCGRDRDMAHVLPTSDLQEEMPRSSAGRHGDVLKKIVNERELAACVVSSHRPAL
jgi:hypothetical protein